MTLSYRDVADIIKMIDASNCDEVIVELADVKIVVRRGGGMSLRPSVELPAAAIVASSPAAAAPSPGLARADVIHRAEGQVIIRAPMTGTFYRAPSPKDPPFVELGHIVKPGDTLCSIEVMKLFTTMTAEIGGKILKIFANSADLVQYDQPLFMIEITT